MKMKPLPGAIGYLCGSRVDIDVFDLPLVRASADQFKSIGLTNANSAWKDAESSLRDINDAIDLLSSMKAKREQADLELAKEITRAVIDFRNADSISGFLDQEFIVCRRAEDVNYGWINCVRTGQKVCEWRWNDLKHDDSSATVSFEFKAFDNKTTEGN